MPGEATFNVSVLVSMRNRIATGLRAIGRDFASTEARVLSLRRSIQTLESTQNLSLRRAALNKRTDDIALRNLADRQAKLLALGDLEANVAQRRQLNAQISAQQERAALRRQSEMLALSRQSNQILERRAAIQAELEAGAARTAMVRGGIGLAVGGGLLAAGVHQAKAAGTLQTNETFLRAIYGYTPRQTTAMRTQAFRLQQQLGNMSAGDVEQMRLTLLGAGLSRRTAGAVLPEVAKVSDVLMARYGTSPTTTATQLAQFANMFGARTAKQFRPLGEDLMRAALMSPGSLAVLQNQASYITPLMRRGFTARDVIALAVTAQREGGQGSISPENLASLLARVQVSGGRMAPLTMGGKGYLGALQLGLPGFVRTHPNYTMPQLIGLLQEDRKRLGPQRFLTDATLAFGLQGTRTALQLAKPQTASMLAQTVRQMASMGTSAQINAERLNTLAGQSSLLRSNMHSLAQVIGAPLVPTLQRFNAALAAATGSLTTTLQKHPAVANAVGKGEFWGGLLLSIKGALGLGRGALGLGSRLGLLGDTTRAVGALGAASRLVTPAGLLMLTEQITRAAWNESRKYPITPQAAAGGLAVISGGPFGGAGVVNIAPGAIVINESKHPEATAQAVAAKLTDHVMKATAQKLKSSAMSFGSGSSPVMNPHVVAPR